jgi:serine/threonine protein phosphatase PrpC
LGSLYAFFGVFDGHGGSDAAHHIRETFNDTLTDIWQTLSELPNKTHSMLSDRDTKDAIFVKALNETIRIKVYYTPYIPYIPYIFVFALIHH